MSGGNRKSADSILIAALASGCTKAEAAKKAGVSESLVYRRLKSQSFRAQVDQARSELVARAVAVLARASGQAAETMETLLDTRNPPAVRLSAARTILETGTRLREAEDFERRIAALEGRRNDDENA